MLNFIPLLLQWLIPGVLAFFTPARCLAVFKAIVATIQFTCEHHADDSPDAQYHAGLTFLLAQYALLDEVAECPEEVDKFFKETLAPMICAFIYGGQDHA